MRRGRVLSISAAGLAAALVFAGCSEDAGTSDPEATRSGEQTAQTSTGSGFLDPSTAEPALARLFEAGGDQITFVGISSDEMAVMTNGDPGAEEAAVTGYRLERDSDEVITEPVPNLPPNPATPLQIDEIDLPLLLGLAAPCEDPTMMIGAHGKSMRTMTTGCAPDRSDVIAYWLDGTPIDFRVDDPARLKDMVNRITEGSDGEITGLMLVQNGTATAGDGSERTYSNLQIGVVESPDRVIAYTVEEPGNVAAGPQEYPDMPNMQVDELDIDGFLACATEMRTRSGVDGGTAYAAKDHDGERIEYTFHAPDGAGGVTTDTNCEPL